jgi:hypothetical protein
MSDAERVSLGHARLELLPSREFFCAPFGFTL